MKPSNHDKDSKRVSNKIRVMRRILIVKIMMIVKNANEECS